MQGSKGSTGASQVGPKGEKGERGPQGMTGPQGLPGPIASPVVVMRETPLAVGNEPGQYKQDALIHNQTHSTIDLMKKISRSLIAKIAKCSNTCRSCRNNQTAAINDN